MSENRRAAERAASRIPGLSQLLSKSPRMFAPDVWPAYFARAAGAETWDLDGNRYIDMSINGIGSTVLGFADPDVDAAVIRAIEAGSMCSLNAPEELDLADLLCELHPWATMARYARSGGEAMAVAVRIARCHTERDIVLFCGYHGWHDWYLAANLASDTALDGHLLPGLPPTGVPRGLTGTAFPFLYNDLDGLTRLAAEHDGRIAAIVMEPRRDHAPAPGFLEGVRDLARRQSAVLVFDEITAGFRLTTGGVHLLDGVHPDIAVFAKAISNGYPMAAIIGTQSVMQSVEATFISSTYWTDRIGPAAALATIEKFRENNVAAHLIAAGRRVQAGWQAAADAAGLAVEIGGIEPLSHFSFTDPKAPAMITLFTQLMLERGFLASGRYYATLAHTSEIIERYLTAAGDVFREIATARSQGELDKRLKGPTAGGGFRRLT